MMDYAFKYIDDSGGLHTEHANPYLMKKGDCSQHKSGCDDYTVVTISRCEVVPANNKTMALAKQPVSVAINAPDRRFQFYRGGVFDGKCSTELDHGVAAVSYGADYIIVKNSWGPHWGEKGYIRMKRLFTFSFHVGDAGVVVERVVEKSTAGIVYPMLTRTNYTEWSPGDASEPAGGGLWDAIVFSADDFRDDRNALSIFLKPQCR
ncbi:hypothetical protein EJB05_33493, partial [Eragrostis curvula]